jgi:hypothetical protein
MNITTDIKPINYLKAKAADLLKHINETRKFPSAPNAMLRFIP